MTRDAPARWASRWSTQVATAVVSSSLLLSGALRPARALPGGAPTPACNGCHGGDNPFDGDLALEPSAPLSPGQRTEFTLRIRESHLTTAGLYVTTGSAGTLTAGSGLRAIEDDLVQSRPMSGSGGVVEVSFSWTAPATPGGADFQVFVLSSNGDGTSQGDRFSSATFSYVWGCDGVPLFLDIDGDGFGEDATMSVDCDVRDGWATRGGDCVDTRDEIFPGAPEVANGKDDDCDGEIDEGIQSGLLYPDADGDGYGDVLGVGREGAIGQPGYSANAEDCDDTDPDVHPDLLEVCDGVDNDCNGEVDDGDGVFASCGIGACARRLEVCDHECEPGEPGEESCNGLDDDCDGEIDEGELCADGLVCRDFRCRDLGEPPSSAGTSEALPVAGPSPDVGTSGPATSMPPPPDMSPVPTDATAPPSGSATSPGVGGVAAPAPSVLGSADEPGADPACRMAIENRWRSQWCVLSTLVLSALVLRRRRGSRC